MVIIDVLLRNEFGPVLHMTQNEGVESVAALRVLDRGMQALEAQQKGLQPVIVRLQPENPDEISPNDGLDMPTASNPNVRAGTPLGF